MESLSFPGLVKIGRSKCPEQRAKELSCSQPFYMELKHSYETKGFLEKTVHKKLENCRYVGGPGTEWFKLSVAQAACLIEATILEDELAKAQ